MNIVVGLLLIFVMVHSKGFWRGKLEVGKIGCGGPASCKAGGLHDNRGRLLESPR